jgi:hypothetical protein
MEQQNKNTATFHGFYTVYSSTTRKYKRVTYEPSFNHILLILIINKRNLAQQELLLAYKFEILIINICNKIVYSAVYEFYTFGLTMTVTGRKVLPE